MAELKSTNLAPDYNLEITREDVNAITNTAEAVTHAPASVPRDGLMARITRVLAAFYDSLSGSLSGPAMSRQERAQQAIAECERLREKFWSDVFLRCP